MASATEETKKTARNAKHVAEGVATTTQVASQHAERSVRTLARDSAFATIGVGDLAISIVRNLNKKAAQLRADAPSTVKTGIDPRQVSTRIERRLEQARTDATKEFDRLTERGRSLVEGVQRSRSTKRASEQVGNARSQVKAAATSVTRASKLVGEAAGESVERVGDDTPVDYESMNLDELKEMARELDIAGRSSMNRDELIKALQAK